MRTRKLVSLLVALTLLTSCLACLPASAATQAPSGQPISEEKITVPLRADPYVDSVSYYVGKTISYADIILKSQYSGTVTAIVKKSNGAEAYKICNNSGFTNTSLIYREKSQTLSAGSYYIYLEVKIGNHTFTDTSSTFTIN
jgi:hypothetical protein